MPLMEASPQPLPIFEEEVRSPSEHDWDAFKQYIVRRYRDEGASLKDVREELQSVYHFAPSCATPALSNMIRLILSPESRCTKVALPSGTSSRQSDVEI
jgi:hypothetical protein